MFAQQEYRPLSWLGCDLEVGIGDLPALPRVARLLLTAAALACARDGPGEREHTLTVLYPVDQRSWAFYVPSQFLVFLPLARRNVHGEFEGWLARSWEHSPDYRTWTIQLRPDVRWHDGIPVTGGDVKFSLDLLAHPDVGGEAPGAYAVRVLDDTTLVVTLRKGASGFWLDYDVTYPKHLLQGLDPKTFYDWDFWTHPVGNGPYRYVRHVPKTMMEFEANPDYFRGRPEVDRVVLKFGEPVITELL
ncbi:MAG: ABC transporter substrate-binding protein, partial [Gemmatimonadales bacterium]